MLLWWTLACADEPEPVCAAYSDSPSTPDTVLDNSGSCGWWTVVVGEYLVVSVEMIEPDHSCEATIGEGLDMPYEPSYANFSDDVPKMTFQVFGESPVSGTTLDISCTEGTEWSALVDVLAD